MRLPLNCTVDYFSDFLSEEESKELYTSLIDEYHLDKARVVIEAGGKIIETDGFKITFLAERLKSNNSRPEHVHGPSFVYAGPIAKLKERVENLLNKEFELAMCLYYPDGNHFAPFHNDQETSGHETIIPSISLGEVREFCFKENQSEEEYSLDLANGSLLVMGAYCQSRYTHSLLKNNQYKKGRINITFREPGFK